MLRYFLMTAMLSIILFNQNCTEEDTVNQSPIDQGITNTYDAHPVDIRQDSHPSIDTIDYSTDAITSLEQCTYMEDSVCWKCGNCIAKAASSVGCKSQGDCALFCTSCMPSSYTFCSYGGPTEADPLCLGWNAPRGKFSACTKTIGDNQKDMYCCTFCPTATTAVTNAKDPDGKCYQFCSSCIPEGFVWTSAGETCEL